MPDFKKLLFSFCVCVLCSETTLADVELICPCGYESNSPTSAIVIAGVRNTGDETTAELRISAIGQPDPLSFDNAFELSTAYYPEPLNVGFVYPQGASLKTGFIAPADNQYHVFLYLQEFVAGNWILQDSVRLEPLVDLDTLGGMSSGSTSEGSRGAVFMDGAATISIAGNSVTLHLPPIRNTSSSFTSGTLQIRLGHFDSPEFFGQSFFPAAEHDLGYTLSPSEIRAAANVTVPFTPTSAAGFDYLHLWISDPDQAFPVLAWQPVRAPNGLPTRAFSLVSVDTLLDTDLDGISDFNEDLMQTDPGNPSDFPGSSTIDVMVLYTSGVDDLYLGEPTARFIHELEFGNQVFANSGVHAELRLVYSQQVDYSEDVTGEVAIAAMQNQEGAFSNLDALRQSVGADLVLLFRPKLFSDAFCGFARVGGSASKGDFLSEHRASIVATIYAECRDTTTIHEIGHNMGLMHSARKVEEISGTFVWSRGHGVDAWFYTIMANYTEYPGGPQLNVFSNPDIGCVGLPCGVDRSDTGIGADAVLSLNTVRFQIAAFSEEAPDSDGDGVPDKVDAFPLDPNESVDTDGDGIGNNADLDDDNDLMPDAFEDANGLDSQDAADADQDADGDGATNLQEYQSGTDPNNAASVDACFSNSAVAPDPSQSSLAIENRLYFANPGSNTTQQSFLRFINPNDSDTLIEVYGIDDGGNPSKKIISFTLAPLTSKQFNAQDMENGNSSKGLTGHLCDGQGKWQLRIRSDNPIKIMGLIRTPDGFLTSVNDLVGKSGNDNLVYFANPASNPNQQTFLRIVNLTTATGTVTITGIDDAGVVSSGTVTFTLGPNESKQMNAQDLENGNTNKGLMGNLDDGVGKWRLTVSSSLDLKVMSLIRTPDGFVTNLSGMVDEDVSGNHVIYFGNPASDTTRQTFLRIINISNQTGTVTLAGIDDVGQIAPGGDVMFELGPNESKQMNAQDLESGNLAKGVLGMLGDGEGRWKLTVSADIDIRVMSLIRTPDGFLTNLSRVTPVTGNVNDVFFFNPASNLNQVSSLRIVNDSNQQASVTISGIDDNGDAGPGGEVIFNVPANSAMAITIQDLENGNGQLGLVGVLGNGTGKWRLQVTSDVDLKVQGLMDTPTGFLTNISRTSE